MSGGFTWPMSQLSYRRTWRRRKASERGPRPIPANPPAAIPAGLEVQLTEREGEWARIVCSNGWSGWVDGRELIDVAAARSMAEALLGRLDAAVKEYEQVVVDAADGRIDQAEFQRRAFQAGMIVNDHEVWFLDLPSGSWYRYDGFAVDVLDLGKG